MWSAEARRGGLLARQPRHGVCVPVREVHPGAADVCSRRHVGKPRGSKERPRRESRNVSDIYIYTNPCVYARYERPPRASTSIWPVRPTVMVALDNVSGFMPPTDFLPINVPFYTKDHFVRSSRKERRRALKYLLSYVCTAIVSFFGNKIFF